MNEMGLDIRINTMNLDELYDLYPTIDYFNEHSLSRDFCDMVCRKDSFEHEPELDKIGRMVGVDIKSLYDMENYVDHHDLEDQLNFLESKVEKIRFQKQVSDWRNKLEGNIDDITNLINKLIDKLSSIDDLGNRLNDEYESQYGGWYEEEIIEYFDYFSDFKIDKGDGYIGNNFGQDLRNFKRFLEFAKENGRTTVWFHYG
jgi:hypothetical protein